NTRLLERGVTREVRMALLGHTFGDTHESYEHVEMPLKREAIRKLDAWSRSKPQLNKRKEETMAPTESDPITKMIRGRAIRAAERLAPACTEIVEQLKGCSYVIAMNLLADLRTQAEHTKTLISILRDWQAANAAE